MICLREGFPVHNPLTAEGLRQGQGGVEPGRDGGVGLVQHQVKESGISGNFHLLPVIAIELGDQPVGLHQLDQGGGGVLGTHLGSRDVAGGVEGHLLHVRSKRKVC